MSDNQRNFGVWGDLPFYFYHDIDSSNTVDGRPMYYWVGQQNRTVPLDAGYVALVDSTNITVQSLNLKNNGQGLLLVETENSLIMGNNVTNNSRAIYLMFSSNNTISENSIVDNRFGLLLQDSSNNTIFRNAVANSYYGIQLSYGWGNTTGNIIYHNNFVNNTQQVWSWGSSNTWDEGYPSGGNYWSDYTGSDEYSGPGQNVVGSDGIGDAAYIIDASNSDRYPLMAPYERLKGDVNDDRRVNILDAILLSNAFNSKLGDANWNPDADFNGDEKVNILDAIILSLNFGKGQT